MASKSVGPPMKGVGSNFQSPLCTTVPAPQRRTIMFGSGMEWVTRIISISNGPMTAEPLTGISISSTFSSRPTSTSLRRTSEAVNGVQ